MTVVARVLFDKDEAAGLVAARRFPPSCQSLLLRVDKKVDDIFISEIAEDPLNPDGVVPCLIIELLQALVVEIACFWAVVTGLVELCDRGF